MIHKRSNSQFKFYRIRYFFIEGAKRLSARIQNTPNKIEFHTVLDEYRSKIEVLNKEYEQIENTKYTDNDQNALAECKTKSDAEKAKIKILLSCPSWSGWGNRGTCSKHICGYGQQQQGRYCINQGVNKSLHLCETSSDRSSRSLVNQQPSIW